MGAPAPVGVAPSPAPTQPQAPGPTRPPSTGPAWWVAFKRLTQFGWPKNFPIVQFPNAQHHGVNWSRNLLGLTYVISTAVHLTLALQH
jgi:hypothetical protein